MDIKAYIVSVGITFALLSAVLQFFEPSIFTVVFALVCSGGLYLLFEGSFGND